MCDKSLYDSFLINLDKKISKYNDLHKDFICCRKGCSHCCEKGDYPISEVEDLSYDLKKRYFLKSKDTSHPLVRVNKTTREKVHFERLNFMDPVYPSTTAKHIIFCRNVLIYFDKKTQEEVIRKLTDHLVPGGYLFLGHSETIFGMNLPLKTVGSTTFQKI